MVDIADQVFRKNGRHSVSPLSTVTLGPRKDSVIIFFSFLSGYRDQVTLIGKRSTEVVAGPGSEMPEKADIFVSELLDTELIGEAVLESCAHAKEVCVVKFIFN